MTSNNSPTNDIKNGSDVRETVHKLIQTTRLHRRVIERLTSDLDMHPSEHRMLMHLSRVETVPSQKEIAEHFKISCAAVANTLKKLEADGYIERGKSESNLDSRYNEISITELGKNAAARTEKYFRCVDAVALNGFSDEEMSLLVSLLDRIQENLLSADQSEETV